MIFEGGMFGSSLAEFTRGPHDKSRGPCVARHYANTILIALQIMVVI
jgi:hypothetical protein